MDRISFTEIFGVLVKPGVVGNLGILLWCTLCIVFLLLAVRVGSDLKPVGGVLRRQRGGQRRKNKTKKRGRKKSASNRTPHGKSALAPLFDLLRSLYAWVSITISRYVRRGEPRDRGKPTGQRNSTLREAYEIVPAAGSTSEASDGVDEHVPIASPDSRGTPSVSTDVGVQASDDNGEVVQGWVTVERPYRRQQSSVSDSTSCSSNGHMRNAALSLGHDTWGVPGRSRGNRKSGYFQTASSKPSGRHGRRPSRVSIGRPSGYRVAGDETMNGPFVDYPSKSLAPRLAATPRYPLEELLSSTTSSSVGDAFTCHSPNDIGKSSSTTVSECPMSPLDSYPSFDVFYTEWVQKLIEEESDDDHMNVSDISMALEPDQMVEHSGAASEFFPALSTVYATLQPVGIWVGLNYLASKIGYASGGWEIIWTLADIGWIELSDCGLYCRLADSWGGASCDEQTVVSHECEDMPPHGVYRGALEFDKDWRQQQFGDGGGGGGGLESPIVEAVELSHSTEGLWRLADGADRTTSVRISDFEHYDGHDHIRGAPDTGSPSWSYY